MPEDRVIETNGVRLHVMLDGPQDGPPVIMLHGFPETWLCWHKEAEILAAAGYRVILPNQRGYEQSDKPRGVRNYRIDLLIADIAGLMDSLGYNQFDLVGHDWGSVVAQHFAEAYPDRVKHLIVSNAPHLNLLAQAYLQHPEQILKSWYVVFFQLPWLPEYALQHGLGRRAMFGHNRFSADEIRQYEQAWAIPGAATAMINWYRASYRASLATTMGALLHRRPIPTPHITVPTLILWGKRDAFLIPELAEAMLKACPNGRLEYFPDASHWLPTEQPTEVSQRILEFIKPS